MVNVEVRKADSSSDGNVCNDVCIECGATEVCAYLKAAIVKVPLCRGCLVKFSAEVNAVATVSDFRLANEILNLTEDDWKATKEKE